jgi:hypothetical protein
LVVPLAAPDRLRSGLTRRDVLTGSDDPLATRFSARLQSRLHFRVRCRANTAYIPKD